MKIKLLLLTILTFITFITFAQKVQVHLFGGMANYEGDIQPKRFTFQQSHLALGIGGEYKLSQLFWLRAQGTMGSISANDKFYSQHAARNLNFTSKLSEFQFTGEFLFRSLEDYRFTPFIFGGVAIFHFNPYTYDSTGKKYYLQPLGTEGQGIAGYGKPYNLTQFSIPFGGGVKINISNRIIAGFEIGFRKTFTDYLDDISGNYVDQNILLTNKGAKSVELAYRGAEIKNGGSYPPAGTIRGNASRKDLYYFSGMTLTYKLGNITSGSGGKEKFGVACPSNSGFY